MAKKYFIWSECSEIFIGNLVKNNVYYSIPHVVDSVAEAISYLTRWANNPEYRETFEIESEETFYVVEADTGKKVKTLKLTHEAFIVKIKK